MRFSKLTLMLSLMLSLVLAAAALPVVVHAQTKQRGDRNRISKDELTEALGGINTAYDAVRTMRPQWLNPPALRNSTATMTGDGGGATDVVVYIDDLRQQSKDDLKTVKAASILELKYLDQNRAIQMRGPGHEMGVIEVTTVNKRR